IPSGHHYGLNCIAFHRDSMELSVGSPAHTISTVRVKVGPNPLDLKDPEIYFLSSGHTGSVNGLAYYTLHGEDRFVSASDDSTIKVWDRKRGVTLVTFKGHLGPVRGIAISPDTGQLASASADQTVKVWDLKGTQEAEILRFDELPVQAVAFSPDKAGQYLA